MAASSLALWSKYTILALSVYKALTLLRAARVKRALTRNKQVRVAQRETLLACPKAGTVTCQQPWVAGAHTKVYENGVGARTTGVSVPEARGLAHCFP